MITQRDIVSSKLKSCARVGRNLISQRTRAKIQLVAYVDQFFPELQKFFKGNIHINTVYKLLQNYTSPTEIVKLHLTKLTNLIVKSSKGYFKKETAFELKGLAKNSVKIKILYLNCR